MRIEGVENLSFLTRMKSWAIFKKKKKFASFPWKSVKIYRLARMGRNFDDYPGFQPKTTFMYYFAHDCKREGFDMFSSYPIIY